MSDIKVFNKIKSGDLKSFENLYNLFYGTLCHFARSYVKEDSVAEDIVQEVFINFWNKRKEYNEIPSLKTFLYVMVKNKAISYIRSNKEKVKITDADFLFTDNFFNNTLIKEETYRIINQAINTLPNQTSKIINLSLQGIKNNEIAENLDISVNTVKVLKNRGLKSLKKILKDYYYILLLFIDKA